MMSSAVKVESPTPDVSRDLQATWSFRMQGAEEADWNWRQFGPPSVEQLSPVRMPRSSASSRHIPVTAYSVTNGGVVHLESGLEHDLVRRLDRDSGIVGIVAQPFRLSWTAAKPISHIPDLVALHDDDAVTVWDVRALEEQDDDFRIKSAVTRNACAVAGWHYQVFTGLGDVERLNLLWLHGFRRRPAWADRWVDQIHQAACRRDATIGSLFAHDDGTGELKAVVWHLVWSGVLSVDVAAPWNLQTSVAARENVGND
jgi:hypothetical protein